MLPLPHGLVHKDLGLLGHAEPLALGRRRAPHRVLVLKRCIALQDAHQKTPSLGGHHQRVVLPTEPTKFQTRDDVLGGGAVRDKRREIEVLIIIKTALEWGAVRDK